MSALGDYFPRGANMYVKNCSYAADARGLDGKPFANLGVFNTLSATVILNAFTTVAGAAITSFAANWNSPVADMGKFGRCLTYVAGAASTANVTARGFDYLGQPMAEQVTLNGTTPVTGNKAFRFVTSITCDTAAVALSVGTRNAFGLPYAVVGDTVDYTNGVRSGTQGTVVVAPLTAQTLITSDPRGILIPNTAPNGTNSYSFTFEPLRGNLYGLPHFYS